MKKSSIARIVALGAVLCLLAATQLPAELALHSLTSVQQHDSGPRLPQDASTAARWRRFERLWQTHKERDIVPQLVTFLSDPFPPLQLRAVRALGELESPTALKPLQNFRKQVEEEKRNGKESAVPTIALNLALGRVASRSLKGKAKLERIVQEADLNWPRTVRLFRSVNSATPIERQQMEGNEVVETLVDVLHAMIERGENVRSVRKELQLRPSQDVLLDAAPLPPKQEAAAIVNSFTKYQVMLDSEVLTERILDLRPASSQIIIARLKDVQARPEKYKRVSVPSFGVLFRVAARLGDPRIVPLLKKFETNPKPWPGLKQEAQIALQIAASASSNLSP